MVVFLVVGGWWLNGPGFRWGARLALEKVLKAQGLEGSFEMDGSLWSGLRLRAIDWREPGTETAIQGAEAFVRLRLWSLLRGSVSAIGSVELREVEVTLDMRRPPDEDEETPEELALELPWPRLPQPAIDLRACDLIALLPGQRELRLTNLKVKLKAGEAGAVSWDRLALPDGIDLAQVSGQLSYNQTGFTLGNVTLGPGLRCQHLAVEVSPERRLQLDSRWKIHGGRIDASLQDGRDGSFKLAEGHIDLAWLREAWLADVPAVDGEIRELAVSVEGIDSATPWTEWSLRAHLSLSYLAAQSLSWQGLDLDLEHSPDGAALQALIALDADNRLRARAAAPPFRPGEGMEGHRWDLQLDVEAPSLAAWMGTSEFPVTVASLTGSLEGAGRGTSIEKVEGELRAGEVSSFPWQLPEIGVRVAALENDKLTHRLSLSAPEDLISGAFDLHPSLERYEGRLRIACQSLARLQPLAPEAERLGGSLVLTWSGAGSMGGPDHEGSLVLQGANVGLASSDFLYETRVDATYANERLALNELVVTIDGMRVEAEASLTDSLLEVSRFTLAREQETWLTGRCRVPLATGVDSLADRFWKAEQALEVELKSAAEIPLADLARLMGEKRPLTGGLELVAKFGGQAAALQGELHLQGRGIGMETEGDFPSAVDLDVRLRAGDGRLSLEGEVLHEHLKPSAVEAEVPFQFATPEALLEAPLRGRMKMPSSPLGFLADYVPGLGEVRGSLTAEVRMSGTVADPEIVSHLGVDAAVVRFDDGGLPTLEGTRIRAEGTLEKIAIKEASTMFQGGSLSVTGVADLTKRQPEIDLRAVARQALLRRNENMVMRANADVRVRGPIDRASVTGVIGLVEGRYFREIEILPTNRPGTSLPSPPAIVDEIYGTEAEPFRDWKIDLRIYTEESFRVRTNLAAADIGIELNLGGTASALRPLGVIDLNDAYAELPFSRLDLKDSAIRFTQQSGFPGAVDIRGESLVHDHRIRVVITGDLNGFDYLLTSTPPLPEEEILALLYTGMKRKDLVGNRQEVVSRAALLLFDRLWRRMAQKDWEAPELMREKRLTFEKGRVNPRTGSPMTTARLRLTDQWSMTGDADMQGDFRGLLHYLFKF